MRTYPKNMRIDFHPTAELAYYVGGGIDTRNSKELVVPRKTALYLFKHFNNNFRPNQFFPSEETWVSAVLCTCEGREKMARYAIQQFRDQTYPNKELIVVNQGPEWLLPASLSPIKNITEIRVLPFLTNGAMRNIGDAVARGSYIIRWDDDDIFATTRIETQLRAIKETGYPASSLRSYTVYIPEDDIVFDYVAEDICVGLLMYKKEGYSYEEDVTKGSDSVFACNYEGLIVGIENPPIDYFRIYHGNNMSTKKKILGLFDGSKHLLVRGARLLSPRTSIEQVNEAIFKYEREYI